jgi:hypothetical protein
VCFTKINRKKKQIQFIAIINCFLFIYLFGPFFILCFSTNGRELNILKRGKKIVVYYPSPPAAKEEKNKTKWFQTNNKEKE